MESATGAPEGQLPRGRHGLPRELIVEAQRQRLIDALTVTVAQKGYVATTVADVVERARVSRATFYEQFADKEECFIAAHETFVAQLLGRVDEAFQALESWPDRVRAGLGALVGALAENPDAARLIIVEVIGAGARAHSRLRTASRAFVPFFDEGRALSPHGAELPEHVSLVVVGGVVRVIFEEVVAERTVDLPQLLPELVYIAVVPYLGPEVALEEMRRTPRQAVDAPA